jgi:hypothetical protein
MIFLTNVMMAVAMAGTYTVDTDPIPVVSTVGPPAPSFLPPDVSIEAPSDLSWYEEWQKQRRLLPVSKKEMFAMAYTEAQNQIKNEQNAFLLQMEYKKKFVEALEDRLTQMNALRAKMIEDSKKSESGVLSTAQELSAKKELENIGASQSAAMANARAQNDLEEARIAARGAVDAANATAEYNAEKLSTAQRQQQLSDISKLVPQDALKDQIDVDLERLKGNTDYTQEDVLRDNLIKTIRLNILGDKDISQQDKDASIAYIATKLAEKKGEGTYSIKLIKEEIGNIKGLQDLSKAIEVADADPNKATYNLVKSLQGLNDLQGSSAKGVNIRSILTADLPEEDRKKFIEIENARAENSIDKIKDAYAPEIVSYDKQIEALRSQIEDEYKNLSEKTLPKSDTIDLARKIYFDKFGKQPKEKQPK